jgi:iron complex outermembrane recepter protein
MKSPDPSTMRYANSGGSRQRSSICPLLIAACGVCTIAQAQDVESLDAILGAEVPDSEVAQQQSGQPESLDMIPVESMEPEEPPPRSRRPPQSRIIEEIIVTAQKREENLQDVPLSIQAFSAEALDARGISDVQQLQQVTPGLQYSTMAGYPIIFLRGVGTDSFLPTADQSIATYIDGIFIPTSNGIIQGLGGIERVEVIKGPQGTLFGRNSTGGAINITTRKPGENFEASAQIAYGNYNERRAKAHLSAPIGEVLGASGDVIYSEVDNQYTHIDGRQIAPEKSLSGRVRLNFHPTENFDIDLSYFEVDAEGMGTSIFKNTKPSLLAQALTITPQENNYVAESDTVIGFHAIHELLTGTLSWRLPWFDFKLIGSDQFLKTFDNGVDFDGSPRPIAVFHTDNQYSDLRSAELQLLSNREWGSDRLEWIVGVYYLRGDSGVDPGSFAGAANLLSLLPTGLRDALPDSPVLDLLNRGFRLAIRGAQSTEASAVFGQASWDFTDWFSATVGGRYQTEERVLLFSNVNVLLPDDSEIPLFSYDSRSESFSNFSPKLALRVRPSDDIMLFASVARGFKSGTFNVVTLSTPGDYVDPETVTTVDLGIKADLFGQRLRLNAAVFGTNIEDLQATFISLFSGGTVSMENVGKAEVRGAEFDLTLLPFMESNPGLVVTASAAYLDSKYTEYPNASGFDPNTGLYSQNNDYSDNRIVRSPKLTAGFGLAQTLGLGERTELEIGADAYYNDGFWYDAANTVDQESYTLVSARLSLLYRPWNLRATVFGTNLLDEVYHVAKFTTDFGTKSTLDYPLRYGMRLDWRF